MSKTLFWYILKDLLRIFLMASGTLAGIMSFGALLRPLTQHGLDAAQVGLILTYFTPAMTTYSFPVAALFATTFVYGRVSADNELTACRACGISNLSMTWPAILLGLMVALMSLLFLSFIVPQFTLKVERVIYSNMAQLIANKITRTHEINYGKTSIFAQGAEVIEFTEVAIVVDSPDVRQQVQKALLGAAPKAREEGNALVMAYQGVDWEAELKALAASLPKELVAPPPATPGDAASARPPVRVALLIRGLTPQDRQQMLDTAPSLGEVVDFLPPRDAQVVSLDRPMIFSFRMHDAPDADPNRKGLNEKANKMRVPEKISMARHATAYITRKGDAVVLQAILENPGSFPRGKGGTEVTVGRTQIGPIPLGSVIRENTKFMDINQLKELFRNPESSRKLNVLVQQLIREDQRHMYFLALAQSLRDTQKCRIEAESEALIISGSDLVIPDPGERDELVINTRGPNDPPIIVEREHGGDPNTAVRDEARQVRISLDVLERVSSVERPRMEVVARGYDIEVRVDEDATPHEKFPRRINVPMPDQLLKLENKRIPDYLKAPVGASKAEKERTDRLKYEYMRLVEGIKAEMHSRASFAVSCFILVLVGAALGMISKSGNFLSAFAVSVIPALLCIALIVTGQHTCENSPKSARLGLGLIWSGNVIVLIMGMFFLWRLQRE